MKTFLYQIYSLHFKIKDLPKRISNLFKWHSVIWKDHQEDYSKLLSILEHKFRLQKLFWLGEGNDRNFRYNQICERLANRVNQEHYLFEMTDYYRRGKIQEYLDLHKRHMKKMYRKVSLGIDQNKNLSDDELAMLAMDIASYKHRKARRLLFKIMYHHLENWQIDY